MNNDIFLVEESLNEFAKRGRKPKARMRNIEGGDTDKWGDEDEDGEIAGPDQVEDITIEDEVGNPNLEIGKALDHELSAPEFSRAYVKFKVLGTGEKIKGIPMAKMSGGSAYLFKTTKGDLKKVKLSDVILENVNEGEWQRGNDDDEFENENSYARKESVDPFTEYMFEVADIVKIEVPDWQAIVAETDGSQGEYPDVVTWLEEDLHGFDFMNSFDQNIPAEEAAMEVVQWLESTGYTESENEFDEE